MTEDHEQPGMFDGLERQGYREKPKRPRSVARGACGKCLRETVLIDRHAGHLVWRLHNYETWAGTRIPCQGSGIRLCDNPARHIPGLTTPVCTCEGTP
jgi:hypothetical protein